jgi:arylsulfatase A-like enzyme
VKEHDFYFEHGDVPYDDNTRVPLIFSLPGALPAGRRVGDLAANVDVLPTVMDLLNIPPVPGPEGRSLVGLMLGESWSAPRQFHILANYVGPWSPRYFTNAMTDGLWKLVYTPEFHILELYDLRNDPLEAHNVWGLWDGDPGRREAGMRLRSALARRMLADKAGHRPEASKETELSNDLMEQLRSLGYVK